MTATEETRNVIIVGSGPAGYTAAIYAARANLAPLVLEGSVTAGGALMTTTEVENFPGFRDGIQGPALMDEMRGQAERFGAELVADDAIELDLTGETKIVKTAEQTYTARAVILAMGSGYRKLGLPDEERLSGHGVSWCATCDGFFFREQHIAVVGGGDSAVEEATFLSGFGSKVTIIHRRDELRASKIMQERAFADPKIEFAWNSEVAEIHGDDKLTGLTLRDTVTGETRELPATGLFIAIGHDPRSELLPGRGVQKLGSRPTQPAQTTQPTSILSQLTRKKQADPPPEAGPGPAPCLRISPVLGRIGLSAQIHSPRQRARLHPQRDQKSPGFAARPNGDAATGAPRRRRETGRH